MKTKQLAHLVLTAPALLGLASAAPAQGPAKHRFSDWSYAKEVMEVNSTASDGCPIESPDGLSVYIASTRLDPLALGANDIWAADRASKDDPSAPRSISTRRSTPLPTISARRRWTAAC